MIQIDMLTRSILDRWRSHPRAPLITNRTTEERLARIAAIEVVDALQANPAWARALGIAQ